jgi:hypothetical protein
VPPVADAFCSECHNPLDEPPATPRTAEQQQAVREQGVGGLLRTMAWILIAYGLVRGIAYKDVIGAVVFLFVGGAVFTYAQQRASRIQSSKKQGSEGQDPK